jgi:hypothetical protein
MLRKVGTPTYACGWWLVPVVGVNPSRVDRTLDTGVAPPTHVIEAEGDIDTRAFVDLIATAIPIARPRKAEGDLGLCDGLEMVAARVDVVDGARVETNHALVLRGAKDGLEIMFLEPVAAATRDEICAAVEERIRIARTVPGDHLADALRSNWEAQDLLSELARYPRADDGTDRMAFRIKSTSSARTMYVYLYGGQPDLIHFDLEDPTSDAVEWDAAVGRGSAGTKERLLEVAHLWLDDGRMIPSGATQHADDGASR